MHPDPVQKAGRKVLGTSAAQADRYPKHPAGRAWVKASPLSPVRMNQRKPASSSIWKREDGRKSCFMRDGAQSAVLKTLQAVGISTVTGKRLCCAQARWRNAPNRSQVAGAAGVSWQPIAVALETTIAKNLSFPQRNARAATRKGQAVSDRLRKRSVVHGNRIRNPAQGASLSGSYGCQSDRSHPGDPGRDR